MNNKKSIFSVKLMLEGFRQCKMIGILALIIMVLGAVLVPAGTAIAYSNGLEYNVVEEAGGINPFLCLVIPAIALMTLVLFHFLDNRASSDLYHSLPHKRITLYLSYTGSILLWTIVLISASSLASIITCLITSKYIVSIMSTVLPYMISVFLITLLAVGGVLTAINLTGTVFTNIVLSGIILFLPRLCFVIVRSAMFDGIPFITSGFSGDGIFSADANLLFGLFAMMFGMNITDTDVFRPEWLSIIYSFVLALIYLAIAAVLFCRRSSESAGQSAPTKMHQHVYRIVITMAYCIVVTAALASDLSSGFDIEDVFGFGILYLIGALIYFAYELITTKRWRNLISSLPGLALVAGLNLGFAVGLNSFRNYAIDQRPKANEITSVSIGIDERYMNGNDWWQYNYYAGMKNSKVKITDPEVISLVSYYLDENVMTWKSDEYSYYNKYHTGDKYTQYMFNIETNGKMINRTVMIPNEDSDKIMSIVETIPGYIENWQNPPKPIDDTISVEANYVACNIVSDDAEKIFDIYCDELKKLSFKDLYEAFSNGNYNCFINYNFSEDGYTKILECPINSDFMPKTTAAYYELVYNIQAEERNKFEDFVNNGMYESIDFNIVGKNEDNDDVYYYCSTSENINDVYSHMSKYIKDEPISGDGLFANIILYPYDYSNETINFVVSLDKAYLKDEYFKKFSDYDEYYY